jgi:hypothetical protein
VRSVAEPHRPGIRSHVAKGGQDSVAGNNCAAPPDAAKFRDGFRHILHVILSFELIVCMSSDRPLSTHSSRSVPSKAVVQ